MKSYFFKPAGIFVLIVALFQSFYLLAEIGGGRIEQLEIRAVVEWVDYENREVVLLSGDGRRTAMTVGPEVRNLDQVEPGDQLVVAYTTGLGVELVPSGTSKKKIMSGVAERAREGQKPAMAKSEIITVTVTIEAIDLESNTVTFTDPDGLSETIFVDKPEGRAFIREIKQGDMVDLTFSHSVAVAIREIE